MLSLCIPVYRYDVRPLVNELLRQAGELKEAVEILICDDASPDDGEWGREELRQTPGVRYVELKQNLGRAAIRNRMAREATFTYLVLMDADGAPGDDYLRKWVVEIARVKHLAGTVPSQFVSVGGRHYQEDPPEDQALHLHWWYGTLRESQGVASREKQRWLGFHSNNFLASQSLLLDYPFPETHDGYGHEDTLWGQQFVGSEVSIHHLDNPVVHLGLETNDVFLQKQKQAIVNLRHLKNGHPHLRTRLTDLAQRFPFLGNLVSVVPELWLMSYLKKRHQPSLYALDLLKLKWWSQG